MSADNALDGRHLKALGLALREIGETDAIDPTKTLSAKQMQLLKALPDDAGLPKAAKLLLMRVVSEARCREDLYWWTAILLDAAQIKEAQEMVRSKGGKT